MIIIALSNRATSSTDQWVTILTNLRIIKIEHKPRTVFRLVNLLIDIYIIRWI